MFCFWGEGDGEVIFFCWFPLIFYFLLCVLNMFLVQTFSTKVSKQEGLSEDGVKGDCGFRCMSVAPNVLKCEVS